MTDNKRKYNKFAVAAFILVITGPFISRVLIYFNLNIIAFLFLYGLLMTICSGIGFYHTRKRLQKGRWMCWIGLIFGAAFLYSIHIFYQWDKAIEEEKDAGKLFMEFLSSEKGRKINEKWGHIERGDKYQRQGKYDSAIEEYKKAADLFEGSPKIIPKYSLAEAYEKAGQYDLALKEIDWHIFRGPHEDIIKELNGWKAAVIYQKEGKYDLAIEEYKKVVDMAEGPDKWHPKESLSRLYEKTGQYVLAIKELDWLISEVDRKEDIDFFKNWKSRLEKLKAAKAAEGK